MKRLVLVASLVALGACGKEAVVVTDTRESIEIDYPTVQQLDVHKAPEASSPVISHYRRGESVSVVSKKEGWLEVRTIDATGWARASELSSKAQDPETDNTAVHFKIAPSAVTDPTAHGQLWFEALVNTDGDVVSVKTVSNTTGSAGLEAMNRESLMKAKFEPLREKGKVQAFTYDYHVEY